MTTLGTARPATRQPLEGRLQSEPVDSTKAIIDNLTTAVLLLGTDLRLLAMNPAAEELLDLSLEEIRAGYEDGTFWPSTMPKYPYIEEALA